MKQSQLWEFPGGPLVRAHHFHCLGPVSIPGRGTKIPKATRRGGKKKRQTKEKKANMKQNLSNNTSKKIHTHKYTMYLYTCIHTNKYICIIYRYLKTFIGI